MNLRRKCLDNRMCTNFDNYFETKTGGINTRNNNLFLKLPKVKLDLPIEIRREGDYDQFLKLLKDYYK